MRESEMSIAEQFMALEQNVRSGSLRTFGCWFGRPMDNYHVSKNASFDGETLKIEFEDGETLEVWNPSDLVIDGITLKIQKAKKVKWSWHMQGQAKSNKTLMYYEYEVSGDTVISKTNSPWPNSPNAKSMAVELC